MLNSKTNGNVGRRTDDDDIAIGQRIKTLRLNAGMSQSDLGLQLGVTFQQVQKYEKGVNRVAGKRLRKIAEILNTSVQYIVTGEVSGKIGEDELSAAKLLSALTPTGTKILGQLTFLNAEELRTVLAVVTGLADKARGGAQPAV